MEQTNLMEENDAKLIPAIKEYGSRKTPYRSRLLLPRNWGPVQRDGGLQLVKDFTHQAAYPYNLTGGIYRDIGQFEKALLEDQEYDRRRPSAMSIGNIVDDLLLLGRLDEAQKVLAEGEARHLKHELLLRQYYTLAFFQQDSDQMEKVVAAASASPEMERVLLSLQADTEAYYGRLKRSRRLRQQAVEACLQHGLPERPPRIMPPQPPRNRTQETSRKHCTWRPRAWSWQKPGPCWEPRASPTPNRAITNRPSPSPTNWAAGIAPIPWRI